MAAADTLFRRITDYANRADPYPLYAELREHGVARQDDGSYLVGTYHEIAELFHDPRVSSDRRNRTVPDDSGEAPGIPVAFIGRDDPEHERLRNMAMRPFGPPHAAERVDSMHGEIAQIAGELIDGLRGRDRIDLVEDFAYPLPVTVICRLLGVPREDEPRFHVWAEAVIAGFDPTPDSDPAERQRTAMQARSAMGEYLGELAESRRGKQSEDMLAAFVNDPGPSGGFTRPELMATSVLLLIAGHETTVNLITNSVLTLLRHPEALELLRDKPELMPRAVEEVLRYEPPVQLLPQRTALTDIEIAGVTIPKGAPLILVLASGNRDPRRFQEPDRFDPTRPDNQHLGFGSGVHSCFGAPLARLEGQIALTALIHRLDGPRLLQDPPEYRRSPVLRGPRHLPLAISGVRD
ncbi:cytochrome P450 [Kitasatospora kifunensis]|uniref:Cytochrome P450 n=1 Tax=Kitasatospora kifunensis TaxID=58351 RepID=A0A7W7R9H9_KITKI|nr:cytochrome P450 [Kitasatospora kifunensis]MBB4927932.1 cytochrome P450 [Kitasatospora kifunensis]